MLLKNKIDEYSTFSVDLVEKFSPLKKLAGENSRHFATSPLVSQRNDV